MSVYGYTTNYRLRKVTFDTRGWHMDEWLNLDTIDGVLASLTDGSSIPFAIPTGTGDALVLNFTPDATAVVGQQISFVVQLANTTAVTVNCDAMGAKALKTAGGAALTSGQLQPGMYVRAIYNGTDFTIIYPAYTATFTPYVSSGSSGAVPDPAADDFYVENSSDVGISLLNPAGYIGRLYFGRPLVPTAGAIKYDHVTDGMTFRLGAVDKVTLSSAGVLDLSSTGYVKQGAAPAFSAYHAHAATSLPTNNNPVIFTSTDINVGTIYNTANGRFTAPVTGNYEFEFGLSFFNASSVRVFYQFWKNGVAIGMPYNVNASATNTVTDQFSGGRVMLALTAGDIIDVRSTSVNTPTHWAGYFVGRLLG